MIGSHFDVENADDALVGVGHCDVRGADLLAEDVDRAIRHGDDVGDLGGADDHVGIGGRQAEASRLPDWNDDASEPSLGAGEPLAEGSLPRSWRGKR